MFLSSTEEQKKEEEGKEEEEDENEEESKEPLEMDNAATIIQSRNFIILFFLNSPIKLDSIKINPKQFSHFFRFQRIHDS